MRGPEFIKGEGLSVTGRGENRHKCPRVGVRWVCEAAAEVGVTWADRHQGSSDVYT